MEGEEEGGEGVKIISLEEVGEYLPQYRGKRKVKMIASLGREEGRYNIGITI